MDGQCNDAEAYRRSQDRTPVHQLATKIIQWTAVNLGRSLTGREFWDRFLCFGKCWAKVCVWHSVAREHPRRWLRFSQPDLTSPVGRRQLAGNRSSLLHRTPQARHGEPEGCATGGKLSSENSRSASHSGGLRHNCAPKSSVFGAHGAVTADRPYGTRRTWL